MESEYRLLAFHDLTAGLYRSLDPHLFLLYASISPLCYP